MGQVKAAALYLPVAVLAFFNVFVPCQGWRAAAAGCKAEGNWPNAHGDAVLPGVTQDFPQAAD